MTQGHWSARTVVDTQSSAIPAETFAMMSAVAGTMMQMSAHPASMMCGLGDSG